MVDWSRKSVQDFELSLGEVSTIEAIKGTGIEAAKGGLRIGA